MKYSLQIYFTSRYAGSVGGVGWILFGPVILLAIYSVVYLLVFRVRVPDMTSYEYVLNVFSGLVPFLAFSQALSESAGAIRSDQGLWSEVNYPKFQIPLKFVVASYVMAPVGFLLTLAGDFAVSTVTISWLWVPLILACQLMFSLGVGYILSIITVVLRDIQFLIQYATIVLLVVTPIAYTVSMIPSRIALLMSFNPLYHYVICYQYAILMNETPPLINLLACIVLGPVFMLVGLLFFRKTAPFISDFF